MAAKAVLLTPQNLAKIIEKSPSAPAYWYSYGMINQNNPFILRLAVQGVHFAGVEQYLAQPAEVLMDKGLIKYLSEYLNKSFEQNPLATIESIRNLYAKEFLERRDGTILSCLQHLYMMQTLSYITKTKISDIDEHRHTIFTRKNLDEQSKQFPPFDQAELLAELIKRFTRKDTRKFNDILVKDRDIEKKIHIGLYKRVSHALGKPLALAIAEKGILEDSISERGISETVDMSVKNALLEYFSWEELREIAKNGELAMLESELPIILPQYEAKDFPLIFDEDCLLYALQNKHWKMAAYMLTGGTNIPSKEALNADFIEFVERENITEIKETKRYQNYCNIIEHEETAINHLASQPPVDAECTCFPDTYLLGVLMQKMTRLSESDQKDNKMITKTQKAILLVLAQGRKSKLITDEQAVAASEQIYNQKPMTQFFLENAADNILNLVEDAVKNDDFTTMNALKEDLLLAFTTQNELPLRGKGDVVILQNMIKKLISLVVENKSMSEGMAKNIGGFIADLNKYTQDATPQIMITWENHLKVLPPRFDLEVVVNLSHLVNAVTINPTSMLASILPMLTSSRKDLDLNAMTKMAEAFVLNFNKTSVYARSLREMLKMLSQHLQKLYQEGIDSTHHAVMTINMMFELLMNYGLKNQFLDQEEIEKLLGTSLFDFIAQTGKHQIISQLLAPIPVPVEPNTNYCWGYNHYRQEQPKLIQPTLSLKGIDGRNFTPEDLQGFVETAFIMGNSETGMVLLDKLLNYQHHNPISANALAGVILEGNYAIAAILINKHNAVIDFSNLRMKEYAAFNGDLHKWLEGSTIPEAKALLNCERLKTDRNKQSVQPH